jgi:hypothetical protein
MDSDESCPFPRSTVENFTAWYSSTSADIVLRRNSIEQKIETLYLPIATSRQRTQERVVMRMNRRQQQVRDKRLRAAHQLTRLLTDVNTKTTARLSKMATVYQEACDDSRKALQERRKLGEELWANMLRDSL